MINISRYPVVHLFTNVAQYPVDPIFTNGLSSESADRHLRLIWELLLSCDLVTTMVASDKNIAEFLGYIRATVARNFAEFKEHCLIRALYLNTYNFRNYTDAPMMQHMVLVTSLNRITERLGINHMITLRRRTSDNEFMVRRDLMFGGCRGSGMNWVRKSPVRSEHADSGVLIKRWSVSADAENYDEEFDQLTEDIETERKNKDEQY